MSTAAIYIVLLSATQIDLPADYILPPPPGPYVEAAADRAAGRVFRSGRPLIATSYFYWYDVETQAHILDHDGTDALTDHPPTLDGFSYKNVDWHARQLADMIEAGIDVLLPVYWGTPLGDHGFSDQGLPRLVAARKRLLSDGKDAPAIGMFYDTSTLRHNGRGYHVDLTTEAGRRWFYGTIRNFFSLIPPQHRALVDGRPLVFLYAAAFAKRVDGDLFPAVREMFRRDFGTDLFLVKMRGWPGEADSQYNWGGALAPQLLDTAGLGPGYDHSAVPGRSPLVRTRDEGRFYEFAWQRLLRMDPAGRPWLVHLETWNEFHEGTEICETREYGRKYLEMTRRFADLFHAGRQIDPASIRPARAVVSAGPGESDGLWAAPKPEGDGPLLETMLLGRKAWSTTRNRFSPAARYMYFEVEDYFLYDEDGTVQVTVDYFDDGPAGLLIEYDSCDPALTGLRQRFRPGPRQAISSTKTWKQVTWTLPHARFAGRANGADFRLSCVDEDLLVARVTVRRGEQGD
jgi:hypothetical protein